MTWQEIKQSQLKKRVTTLLHKQLQLKLETSLILRPLLSLFKYLQLAGELLELVARDSVASSVQ
jgi:hypothetical protein